MKWEPFLSVFSILKFIDSIRMFQLCYSGFIISSAMLL